MEHSNENYVILVDEKDNPLGTMEKIEAHEKARLHRAFSVFIYNSKNELMLQQRALTKYHTPGLWTNTCCSHQKLEESNIEAGKRRLQEEMGFSTELKETISFIYKAPFENGLTEHEFDYILVGEYENGPQPNPDEVNDWKWMSLDDIENDINKNPNLYTEWFKIIFEKHKSEMVKSSI
jgi:isopentenyl-diphosphate delta-isomerase